MIRWLYDFGFFIFAVVSLPHFLERLRQAHDPGRLIRERFGFLPPDLSSRWGQGNCLWIHGVSVGEVLAVEKLIRLILERRPDLYVVLTTVTPTGQQIAKPWEGARVSVIYFPFDFQFAVSRFFEVLKPVALLLVETEIWPNVVREAGRRKIPVGIINGRLSERSARAFGRFSVIFRPILSGIDFFLMQTEEDRERLMSLGVNPSKVTVTGNMKFDAFDLNGKKEMRGEALREKWGFLSTDKILIGGSTHQGEEEILLRALTHLRKEGFSVKLLLAPRHIERTPKIFEQVRKEGFKAALASQRGGPPPHFDVLILDQLGVLRDIYGIADAVVMGGSLVRRGGQNPIEPASFSRPIIHGPWVFNFHEIYRRLDEAGGSLKVSGEKELVFVLKRILESDSERQHLGNHAYEVLQKLRGASERNFEKINQLIKHTGV